MASRGQAGAGAVVFDDSYYAMIASHFPAPGTASSTATPTAAAAAAAARQSNTPALGRPSHSRFTGPEQRAPSPGGALTEYNMTTSTATSIKGDSRANPAYCHPQATRSGRVPVPPPEEELQAMLAMDNYFEFPSESESDDEDFVLPASEPNDDDDEGEDETPQEQCYTGKGGRLADSANDIYLDAIDSAEYEWLMDNLQALENGTSMSTKATTSTSPQVVPQASTSANLQPPLATRDVAISACQVHELNSGKGSRPAMSFSSDYAHQTARQATSPRRTRTQPARSIVDREAGLPHETLAPRRKRMRVDAEPQDDGKAESSSITRASTPSITKADLKRQRNAEQSRTFRERQRTQKELAASKLEALEQENRKLRSQVSVLEARLEALEGRRVSQSPLRSSKGRNLHSKTTDVLAYDGAKENQRNSNGGLSFEDLGKFVSGFLHHGKDTTPHSNPLGARGPSASSPSSDQPSDVNQPDLQASLLALTALLSRRN